MSASDLAALRLARATWHHLTSGWRTTPPGIRRRWLWSVLGGLGLCLLLTAALTFGARWLDGAGHLGWEPGALRWLDREESPFSFQSALFLQGLGSSTLLVPLVVLASGWAAHLGRPFRALAILAAFLGSKALTTTGWMLWNRDRPDLIAGGIAAPGVHSYPSGHTVQSLALFGLLTWFWTQTSGSRLERALAWLLLAGGVVAIGVSRVRIGAHWSSDVVAGLIIGTAWLAVLLLTLARAERANR